jgi:ribosomal protein S18
LHDVKHLTDFKLKKSEQKITEIDLKDLEKFTKYVNELGMQHIASKIISGIKKFFFLNVFA